MAFSFGAAPAASSGGFSFGGAAAPAASSAPAFGFGAAPAPAAGASSGGFSFGGAAAAPAAAASSGGFSFGGGAAAPAASSPSLFGAPAASTPGFGSAFGAPASSAAASSGGFGFGGALVPVSSAPAAAAPSPFGGFGAAAPAAAPAAPAGGGALTYSSKFDDLPPQIKDSLNKLQQQISQAESDRVAVSQMPHLQEGPSGGKDVGAEAASLQSELRSVRGSMKLEEEALENFREKAVVLLKAADAVVRTFQRTKLWRDAPTQFKGQVMPTAMQELLSQPVLLPSPFLEQAVAGFADQVREFRKTVSELESAVAADAAAASGAAAPNGGGFPGGVDATMALPTVVGNLHDYFTHVAAKLERVHVELQTAKAAYRSVLQAQGVYRDPFEKAQAAAEKVAKARPHVPSLMPPPPGAAAAAAAATAAAAAAAPAAAGGFGGGGGFGAGFGSPFPGTPGAFGTPPGAAAALGRTSSKTNRPSKSRR